MPTYGYKCPKCGREWEKIQKITASTRAKCPKCGTAGVRVISGGIGVMFKGSGFYETDYKRAGQSTSGGEGGGTEKVAKSDKSEKSEKPAEKTADKAPEKSPPKAADKPAKESKKKPGAES